jgi:predicted dehydrogenase
MSYRQTRRQFLQHTTTAAAAGAVMPYWFSAQRSLADDAARNPSERLRLGCIGTGDRWKAVGSDAMRFATCVAVCDVDANHAAEGQRIARERNEKAGYQGQEVDVYEDYQKVLERDDVDIVTIVTPDHWHSKIAIEALQAGKDVYCEKPLTLTINEGKQIIKVLRETGRVFQVGTQQRTEMGQRFLGAIAILRAGRIGEVKRVVCDIGGAPTCGPIPVADVPEGLNWEKWQGQAPLKEFRFKPTDGKWGNSRCHYEFRWWYEYSGGKLTDWGAHHVDIATWAIGMSESGPTSVEGLMVEHPVPLVNGMPTEDDRYNTASKFDILVMYPNGVEMHIVSHSPQGNGILFEGTEGAFHVSRGDMKDVVGTAVADVLNKTNPLPEGAIEAVYGKKVPGSHMENFIQCVRDRSLPISDVYSHHRAMTTCHLANIAIRLGRRIEWDPAAEQIVGDPEANQWLGREQRKGYEINVTI